jgi:hypothetical protein
VEHQETPDKLKRAQDVLRQVSEINEYLDKNPDMRTGVAIAMAALQGPKAAIQTAVMAAAGETELGQALNKKLEELSYRAGKVIAEAMEGETLDPGSREGDFLIGGGGLIGSTITGVTGGKLPERKVTVGAKGKLNTSLLDELTANGVKFTPENVIATTRSPSGKVVFLETGNSKAGLQHIIEEHGSQFAKMGVSEAQIPGVVMKAVSEGKLVGYQGSGVGRPIYELTINGQPQRIAVTVGDNGFVVGASPRGSVK